MIEKSSPGSLMAQRISPRTPPGRATSTSKRASTPGRPSPSTARAATGSATPPSAVATVDMTFSA